MDHQPTHDHSSKPGAYGMLLVNLALSLVAMYFVMFSMIDGWGDFRNNLNMFYMALTMACPMGILMLLTMPGMYPNRKLNLLVHLALALVFVAALAGTRQQALIGDRQFIASMIPHHSGAILMCDEAKLADKELIDLCRSISTGQREEIRQLKEIAKRLGSSSRAASQQRRRT